jgi:hypothetical protein
MASQNVIEAVTLMQELLEDYCVLDVTRRLVWPGKMLRY